MADWSQLPEDLLGLIAVHLFSVLEVIRFRSICRSWRSSVPITNDNNSFLSRRFFQPYSLHPGAFLTRTAFYRVTLSSSSSKGWLIKSNAVLNSETFHLLHPLSCFTLRNSCESLDLLNFTVTEIGEAYAAIQDEWRRRGIVLKFKRLVFARVFGENHHRVLGVGTDRKIKYWNGKEWKRLAPKASPFTPLTVMFYDIIVHKGLTYALDSKGGIWWISSSLEVLRYGPPLDKNITNGCCGEKNLVECCGEFYIVDRLYENKTWKRKADCFDSDPNVFYFENTNSNIWSAPTREQGSSSNSPRTVGFKVYKMDEKELGKLVEVKSLGENAFVMLTDSCFSVMAHEYYGCLQNSIYFTDKDGIINVFKLDDGSIEIMTEFSQSCFQMFVPSFF